MRTNYTVCADFPNVVAQRHIYWGRGTHPGGYEPQIRTGPIFFYSAPLGSGLSARAAECQKLKIVGQTSMAKCKALTGSAVKGLKFLCRGPGERKTGMTWGPCSLT